MNDFINLRYDPYSKVFSREYYEFEKMKTNRQRQIEKSLKAIDTNVSRDSLNYGLILSTLGRQGSPKIMENLMSKLNELNKNYFLVFLSEIFPEKLKLFNDQIDT